MGMEYELKFSATKQLQQQILQAFPGTCQEFSMETTYFDTPAGALSARRYTLRRRLENGRSICTLKTPGKGMCRGEWEIEAEDILSAIPKLCKLGAPADLSSLLQEGIVPICGARFHRIAKTLVLAHCTLELAFDGGVLMGGGKESPLCEIEIELKSGSPSCCDAFAAMLSEKYGLLPEKDSKFRRALTLYKGESYGTTGNTF